jgi:hypothetical protein
VALASISSKDQDWDRGRILQGRSRAGPTCAGQGAGGWVWRRTLAAALCRRLPPQATQAATTRTSEAVRRLDPSVQTGLPSLPPPTPVLPSGEQGQREDGSPPPDWDSQPQRRAGVLEEGLALSWTSRGLLGFTPLLSSGVQ